jgi:hypothetical protein
MVTDKFTDLGATEEIPLPNGAAFHFSSDISTDLRLRGTGDSL